VQERRSADRSIGSVRNHAEHVVEQQWQHSPVHRHVAPDMEPAEIAGHFDTVGTVAGQGPWRHQQAAHPGQIRRPTGRRQALTGLERLQQLDQRGGVFGGLVPHRVTGICRHGQVLHAAHGGNELAETRTGICRPVLREAAVMFVFGVECFGIRTGVWVGHARAARRSRRTMV
jgi:hypothetical protein